MLAGHRPSPEDWYEHCDECADDIFRAGFICVLLYIPWPQANGGLDTAKRAKEKCLVDAFVFIYTCSSARFALSKPPFACSQVSVCLDIQVHQARFICTFCAVFPSVCLQPGCIHKVPSSAYIVSEPALVLVHTHSFRFGYPWDLRDSVISDPRHPWVLGLAALSLCSSPGTLGAGSTQSLQPPTYPGDWRDSVLSGPQVPYGLAGISSFNPPSTLGTDGTQSCQPPRYPEDWRDSVLLGPQVPDTLETGGTQSFQVPRYPEDWRDSVLLGPQVPWNLGG